MRLTIPPELYVPVPGKSSRTPGVSEIPSKWELPIQILASESQEAPMVAMEISQLMPQIYRPPPMLYDLL